MNMLSDDAAIGALNRRRNWMIRILICVAAILIVAIIGPFSTFERFSLVQRLLYWGMMIGGSFLPAHLTRLAVRSLVSGCEVFRDAVAVIVIGFVLAPVIWWANTILLTETLAHWTFLLQHLIVIWMICTVPLLIRLYYRSHGAMPGGEENPKADQSDHAIATDTVADYVTSQPLLRHVAPEKHGPILRVSASDHQLLIFTEHGETRVRMRFADALTQLDTTTGMQVHRSHWVAKAAVAQFAQDGRRYSITLQDGSVVPVSSSRVDDLKAAGFEPQDQGAA